MLPQTLRTPLPLGGLQCSSHDVVLQQLTPLSRSRVQCVRWWRSTSVKGTRGLCQISFWKLNKLQPSNHQCLLVAGYSKLTWWCYSFTCTAGSQMVLAWCMSIYFCVISIKMMVKQTFQRPKCLLICALHWLRCQPWQNPVRSDLCLLCSNIYSKKPPQTFLSVHKCW